MRHFTLSKVSHKLETSAQSWTTIFRSLSACIQFAKIWKKSQAGVTREQMSGIKKISNFINMQSTLSSHN